MISAGDFRKGVTFEYDGSVYSVVDFQHVKPGKGAAFVRTKIKNVVTGQVLERTFNPTEKVEEAKIERKEMQYLYNEGGIYYFMDMETFEQIPLNYDQVEEAMKYVIENMMVSIQFYKGKAFSVLPPMFVELNIVECEPGIQGDTSKAGCLYLLIMGIELELTQEQVHIWKEYSWNLILVCKMSITH